MRSESHIVIAPVFIEEITRSAVQVNLRAIRHLQRPPLAIDLYIWLTYRMSYLRRPCLSPWEALRRQFGADYARPADFRRRFLRSLRQVLRVYPRARVRQCAQGFWLLPSAPDVLPLQEAEALLTQ